eukprot:scaffold3777_cov123-Isochrysis_galbana.AAC.9
MQGGQGGHELRRAAPGHGVASMCGSHAVFEAGREVEVGRAGTIRFQMGGAWNLVIARDPLN